MPPLNDLMPLLLSVFQIFLGIGLFTWLVIEYKKSKYQTIKYLLTATTILILAQITAAILTKAFQPGDIDFQNIPTIIWAVVSASELIATFCLLLFFEAFNSERVLTSRNITILTIIAATGTGIMSYGIIVSHSLKETGILLMDVKDDIWIIPRELDSSALIATGMFTFFLIMSVIMSAIMGIILFKHLNNLRRRTENIRIKKSIRKMSFTVLMLILAPIILSSTFQTMIGGQIGIVIVLICTGAFFLFYMQGGMFLIQSRSLRRLIIIDQGGIPVYSYVFQHFDKPDKDENETEMSDKDQEILFSGALKAITILLEEFTGAKHTIEEIFFGNLLMMIKQCQNLSIVLVAERSTLFFKEALESFSNQLPKKISGIATLINFTEKQSEKTSKLLESQFGVGGRVDTRWLKMFH